MTKFGTIVGVKMIEELNSEEYGTENFDQIPESWLPNLDRFRQKFVGVIELKNDDHQLKIGLTTDS